MERVFVVNEQGQREEVDAVRYFEYNGFNYLIYDKNEKDENGYIKLYVNKDQNGNIVPIAEDEWTKLKSVFQNILKANRDGSTLPVNDLNLNANEIRVNPGKAFKLADNVVELLGKNKKVFADTSSEQLNNNSPLNNTFGSVPYSSTNNSSDSFMSMNTNNLSGNISGQNDGFNSFGIDPSVMNNNLNAPFNSDISSNIVPNQNNLLNQDFNNMNNNSMFGNTNNFGQMGTNMPDNNQSLFNTSSFGSQPLDNSNNISFTNTAADPVDYKALYEEEIQKNESLTSELNSVKSELGMFTTKFEQLKQIIG